jgi:LysM repeat protein
MTAMSKRASVGLLLAGLVIAVAAACGGGGGGDGGGDGQRVTDPAKVPSSTPISRGQPQVYQINQDGSLSISGGAPVTGTPLSGGGSAGAAGTYTVQPGDTCGDIASRKGITVAELIAANRAAINADCTNLRVGDELKIPGASGGATPTRSTGGATATPRAGSRTYTVASGDTCGAIAANQGVKVEDLIALNGLDSNCTSLQVGQVLRIPG